MVFKPPKCIPNVEIESIPDSIPISSFMLDEKYGRSKLRSSGSPFICGLSGAHYTALEVDSIPLSWAIHNLSGVSSPANSAYNASELSYQLKSSGSKAIFTCNSLLETALKAATSCDIPRKHVYILVMSHERQLGYTFPKDIKTVDQLILEGSRQPSLEPLRWSAGQGARQCAFLNYSSGTTGLPVPPIVIQMINSKSTLEKFDIGSVSELICAAAPLGAETYRMISEQYPSWYIRQGYGMTETAVVISVTSTRDIFPGSAGTLVPGVEARIVSLADGSDITECNKAGELLLKSPSVTNLGYLNNGKATQETFGLGGDGWLRTGDEAMFLRNPDYHRHEHLFIIDRVKELIKVNGLQVPPAELEACLLNHPLVADVAVIPVPDIACGEVPKAFVVLAPHDRGQFFQTQSELAEELEEYIRQEKAPYKWLRGGIEFLDVIPKSSSGKILRRILRDAERLKGKKEVARL